MPNRSIKRHYTAANGQMNLCAYVCFFSFPCFPFNLVNWSAAWVPKLWKIIANISETKFQSHKYIFSRIEIFRLLQSWYLWLIQAITNVTDSLTYVICVRWAGMFKVESQFTISIIWNWAHLSHRCLMCIVSSRDAQQCSLQCVILKINAMFFFRF